MSRTIRYIRHGVRRLALINNELLVDRVYKITRIIRVTDKQRTRCGLCNAFSMFLCEVKDNQQRKLLLGRRCINNTKLQLSSDTSLFNYDGVSSKLTPRQVKFVDQIKTAIRQKTSMTREDVKRIEVFDVEKSKMDNEALDDLLRALF